MPIKIPNALPAAQVLTDENIFIMTETRALTQDIRPLEIVLLNLMPTKVVTETQLTRLLGNTPLQVHLELMHTSSHVSKNVSQEHLLTFYKSFDELKHRKNVLTFSDIELLAVRLLANPDGDGYQKTAQGEEISRRYDAVIVDEFQDSNIIQDIIFRAVSNEEKNLVMG